MKHKMMPKSVVTLLSKICFLHANQPARDPTQLKQNHKFNELIDFVAANWVEGSLAGIKDAERIEILTLMMRGGISSRRLLGATSGLVISGKIQNMEALTQILYVMARSNYNPALGENTADQLFL